MASEGRLREVRHKESRDPRCAGRGQGEENSKDSKPDGSRRPDQNIKNEWKGTPSLGASKVGEAAKGSKEQPVVLPKKQTLKQVKYRTVQKRITNFTVGYGKGRPPQNQT